MSALRRRTRTGLVAGLVVLSATAALVVAPATGASAGLINCIPYPVTGTLASGAATESGPEGAAYWDVNTQHLYWSVIATRGSQGSHPDAALYGSPPSPCSFLDSSTDPDLGHSDWVAFDNNSGRLPVGTYTGRFYNAGQYYRQFVAGGSVLYTDEPTVDQPMGLGGTTSWIADVHDVYLSDGVTYHFTVTGGFNGIYLLHSKPSDSTTWTRTKSTVNLKLVLPDTDPNQPPGGVTDMVRTGTLNAHVVGTSDWFGLLVVRNAWWGKPVTVRVSTS
jgi:hypothetical protein